MNTYVKHSVATTRAGQERSAIVEGAGDQQQLTARVRELLNRYPTVGLAVGVVRNGALTFFDGHGFADIASQTPITEDTVFRIASITKTFTAIAVMQLWERGLVDLDAPANDYLRAYKLIPGKPSFRPATVRHLLTHTAGIPQALRLSDWLLPVRGEGFKIGQAPTLAEYYHDRGGLRLVVEPGTTFAYGDHTFGTLGQLVEDHHGERKGDDDPDRSEQEPQACRAPGKLGVELGVCLLQVGKKQGIFAQYYRLMHRECGELRGKVPCGWHGRPMHEQRHDELLLAQRRS